MEVQDNNILRRASNDARPRHYLVYGSEDNTEMEHQK